MTRFLVGPGCRVLLTALLPACLAACGAGGFKLDDLAVDSTLTTGSVTPPAAPVGSDMLLSDQAIIRNAVSSVIVEDVGDAGVGWANAQTGSRGAIQAVRETRENSILCRSFATTRESYEGVHLYTGKTCLGANSQWSMLSFDKQ